jgi:hypothetical protein
LILYRGASLLKLPGEGVKGAKAPAGKRGQVKGFSDAARRRLMQLLAMVRRGAVPLFVTLTYPDVFPKDFAVFKAHLEAFGKRVRRRWPEASLVWRLEFQPRKSGQNRGQVAPHFHLFVYGVPWEFAPQVERGAVYSFQPQEGATAGGGVVWETVVEGAAGAVHRERSVCFEQDGEGLDKFMCWCSRNWFDVVGSGEVKHYRAGTRVERIRSAGAVFAYAAKRYLCKPEEAPKLGGAPGRFWGVIGRRALPMGKRVRVALTAREVVQLRRLVRRYRRANTKPERRKWLRRQSSVLFCHVEVWIEKLGLLRPKVFAERVLC